MECKRYVWPFLYTGLFVSFHSFVLFRKQTKLLLCNILWIKHESLFFWKYWNILSKSRLSLSISIYLSIPLSIYLSHYFLLTSNYIHLINFEMQENSSILIKMLYTILQKNWTIFWRISLSARINGCCPLIYRLKVPLHEIMQYSH